MSSYCTYYAQTCYDYCCDSTGYCPSSAYSCYYYYNGTVGYRSTTTTTYTGSMSTGGIIGLSLGIVFIALMIGLGIWCRRRRMAAAAAMVSASNTSLNGTTVIIPGNTMGQPVYPSPFGQPNVGGYQPYQPQPYGQQAYNPNPIGYQGYQ